ncbi:MAG: hypothetical protein QW568_04060 [Candidatus Anstonellaceae archaeon]
MEKTLGQAGTEYVGIIGILFVIAILAVALTYIFPTFAADAQKQRSDSYWSSAKPFEVNSNKIAQNRMVLALENTEPTTLTITALKVNGQVVDFGSAGQSFGEYLTSQCAGGSCAMQMRPGQAMVVVTDALPSNANPCNASGTVNEGQRYAVPFEITYTSAAGQTSTQAGTVDLSGYCSGEALNFSCPYSPPTYCCGAGNYSSLTSHCCTDASAPYVCTNTQFCNAGSCLDWPVCGGTPYNNYVSGCCGSAVYSLSTQGCCSNNVYNLSTQQCCSDAGTYLCSSSEACFSGTCAPTCGTQGGYNTTTQGCCNGNIYNLSTSGCCNNNIYDKATQSCCNSQLTYNTGSQICCANATTYLCALGNQTCTSGSTCQVACNGVPYNNATNKCCFDFTPNYLCLSNQTCSSGICVNPPPTCGGTPYNSSLQGCCNSTLYNVTTQSCCASTIYNLSTTGCCNLNVTYSLNTTGCCNNQTYNKTTTKCCTDYAPNYQCSVTYSCNAGSCSSVPLIVTAPQAGANLTWYDSVFIGWWVANQWKDYVRDIELFDSGGSQVALIDISLNTYANNSTTWTVPSGILFLPGLYSMKFGTQPSLTTLLATQPVNIRSPIIVVSPVSGATLTIGQNYTVSWTVATAWRNYARDIELFTSSDIKIANIDVSVNNYLNNSTNWSVPLSLSPGQYVMKFGTQPSLTTLLGMQPINLAYPTCNGSAYNPSSQQCCSDATPNYTCSLSNACVSGCCGYTCNLTKYCPTTKGCCANTNLYNLSQYDACCGANPYNSTTSGCCGSTIYNKTQYVCCGTSLYAKPTYNACCGTSPYNSGSAVCCSGSIYNGANACCGTIGGYNSATTRCCSSGTGQGSLAAPEPYLAASLYSLAETVPGEGTYWFCPISTQCGTSAGSCN